MDKRFRNGVRNIKSMPGAECGSGHNPVIATIQVKLKKTKKNKKVCQMEYRSSTKTGSEM